MQQSRFLGPLALAVALVLPAGPALAQAGMVPQPNPVADRLAQEMRIVAADPRNVPALLRAGELSARLGDTAAAFAFFARAQAIEPANPRILAGRAMALVRLARPGEALRLLQTAEAQGLAMRDYAADRGLAYDLLGQPLLAQRDYQLALQAGRDDETVRRYALSLGITGKVDEAMRQLDPLLRRSDRAAWRARAFILAMNGDVPGAERIAASMMPGNMGAALTPFFRRLGGLAPGDRAFAVHFGELSATPARLADARLAPQLPPSAPQTGSAQVAQARPATPPSNDRRSRRETRADARAAAATPPARTRATPVRTNVTRASSPPVRMAQARPIVQPLPTPAPTSAPEPAAAPAAATVRAMGGGMVPSGEPAPEQPRAAPAPQAQVAAAAPAVIPPAARQPQPGGAEAPAPPEPRSAAPAASEAAAAPPPGPARVGEEDAVLASIIANLTIPAEELEVVTAMPVALPPAPVRATAPAKPAPKPVKPAAKPAKKPEPKVKPPAAAEPSRIWVQVAGGANEAALPRAWQAVAAKAPAAFKGKTGWWTPLRATNRVLAGPFKTSAEAQAFVNLLAKADVSAFVFTSEAGQKVTKLDLK